MAGGEASSLSDSKSTNRYYRSDSNNFISEIRQMMHGFGDCSNPLKESAKIIEEVVLHQMRAIVRKACENAERRGVLKKSNVVGAEDFIFLLRKDKVKLQRLIKYLEMKRLKNSVYKVMKPDDSDDIVDIEQAKNYKPRMAYREFLKMIDNTGELLENKSVDEIKLNRCVRAEMMSLEMDELHYLKFSNARNASFANKNRHKFNEWICVDSEITISKEGYVILGYLAYETVAQIVDLVFLVRQDQTKIYGDAIDRLKLHYVNQDTYKPYAHGKGTTAAKQITPAEINEALRRYWSPQLDMTGPFHRWSVHPPHLKFLSC